MAVLRNEIKRFAGFMKGIVCQTRVHSLRWVDNQAFLSWLNNHMAILLILIQNIRGRDTKTMIRIEFFLHDLEHHFIDPHAKRPIRHALRYLKRYFKVYPRVSLKSSMRAAFMTARIYEALGLKFGDPSGFISKKAKGEIGIYA